MDGSSASDSGHALVSVDRTRAMAARYERNIMRLGCVTTFTWIVAAVGLVMPWAFELAGMLGLGALGSWLLAGLGALGCRELVLVGFRRLRDVQRRRWLVRPDALPAAPELGHLPPPLAALVGTLHELRTDVQTHAADPDVALAAVRAWLGQVAALEPEHQRRLRELGLDLSPLVVLTRLRREQGEMVDLWNERAHRRLRAAVPILMHFERQLTSLRDDVYR